MPHEVAMKVIGTVRTSSPAPTPAPSSARCSAEVPELTPTQCLAPTWAANAFSNAVTFGPRTYAVLSATALSSRLISSRSPAYWARRSASGTGMRGTATAGPPQVSCVVYICFSKGVAHSQEPCRDARHDRPLGHVSGDD